MFEVQLGYHSCPMGKQRPRFPVGNHKKLAIGNWTDSNGNDPGMNNGPITQIYWVGIFPKETTATAKEGQNS